MDGACALGQHHPAVPHLPVPLPEGFLQPPRSLKPISEVTQGGTGINGDYV